MKLARHLSLVLLILVIAHVTAPVVAAHPLGNFTLNQYAGLHVSRTEVRVDYVLDMAEIPAFQEISRLDANGNGQPDPGETGPYAPAQCESIRSQLALHVEGRPVALALRTSSIEFPPGAGNLLTLRLSCRFNAPIALADRAAQIEFHNDAFSERPGWREIVIQAEGVALAGEFSTESLSQRLTAYPNDLLSSPLDQRQVSFALSPSAADEPHARAASSSPAQATSDGRRDAFTELIALPELTPLTVLIALGVALAWGAAHALTPGHGKTIVGAYLVGARGTARHALYLGLTTTLTHTAGVFALGAITLFASEYILPETLFPWLSLLSGLLVVALGLSLFLSRLRNARRGHAHDHHHDHAHAHDHDHHHDHAHPHTPGGHTHSHAPPGADGAPVTWRSLLTLGISGGLIPCPSALVVLLGAIALNRVAFGLVLVLAFSLGLAGTLTAIGLALVYARRWFDRMPAHARVSGLVSAGSALFISIAGLGITAQALAQMGLITL